MKLIHHLPALAALACLPLAAQDLPAQPPQASATLLAAKVPADTSACSPKGCPEKDQFGNPPLSCNYEYGMATGFHCILECHYKTTLWGSLVASSNCN